MRGLSLFSGAGIGETFLSECGIDIAVANEIVPRRAELYRALYPECNMINGDITDEKIFDEIINSAKGIEFMIASPPCQGMSIAGKGRGQETMEKDERNYLISYVFSAIEKLKPKYVVIENVPALLRFMMPYKGEMTKITDILQDKFGADYQIEGRVVDAADYGVPQTRLRTIIKMWPKDKEWAWPAIVEKKTTVREAIGHLPTVEAGEKSDIYWHFARKHDARHILWMKHTETGHSAFENEEYYPKKADGTKIKGYDTTYRRMVWDEPAPTITIRNDAISSQRNVHPGRKLEDGTYSDARVLTPYELMILSSLPEDWNIPKDTSEILIRQVIGEAIPPLMIKKIVSEIV